MLNRPVVSPSTYHTHASLRISTFSGSAQRQHAIHQYIPCLHRRNGTLSDSWRVTTSTRPGLIAPSLARTNFSHHNDPTPRSTTSLSPTSHTHPTTTPGASHDSSRSRPTKMGQPSPEASNALIYCTFAVFLVFGLVVSWRLRGQSKGQWLSANGTQKGKSNNIPFLPTSPPPPPPPAPEKPQASRLIH